MERDSGSGGGRRALSSNGRFHGPVLGMMAALFALVSLAGAAQAGTDLVLAEHEYEDIQRAIDLIIKDFQATHPGVTVKRAHYKTEDLRTQFQTAAMAGGGADVLWAPNDFAGPFSVMGIIQPVESLAKPERFAKEVVAAASDASGHLWGVPLSRGNHLMLFVNKKLLPKGAPATIEELIEVAKPLSKEAGHYGLAYNLNEPFWFASFLGAFGEQPLERSAGKVTPHLDGPGMIGALSLVRDLKFKDKIVPPDCDYTCALTLFSEGKAAMTINGDWELEKLRHALGDQLIIAPLPTLQRTGKAMVPLVSGKYLFLNARLKGERLAAAKAFADYLTAKETQIKLVELTHRLPALAELDSKSAVIAKDPVLVASDRAMSSGRALPMDVEMRVVWDAMRPQLQAVMSGRAEPKAAAEIMQKDALTKIRELR